MKKRILISLFSLSIAGYLSAQSKDSTANFSLKQAIDYAMKNQSSALNAELDKQIAEAKRKEVIGMGLPQISASGNVQDFLELPTSLIPAEFFGGRPGTFIGLKFGTKYNASGEIDASQLVFDGSFFLAVKASKTYLEVTDKAATRSRIEVAAAVSKAYYNVLITEDRIKLLDANLDRLKKLKDDTKALYDNGFVEKIDLDRVTVSYNNLMTEKDKTLRYAELGYNMLKYQIGMDLKSKLNLTEKLSDINFTAETITNDNFDPSKRIEYSMLKTQLQLNKLDMKRNKIGYLPSIVLYGSVSENAYRTEIDFFDTGKKWYPTSVVGAKIMLPIFDGGQKHYRVEQSRLTILKTQNDMRALEQGLNLEYMNAKTGLINANNSLETQKKNIELATEVYNVTKKKYEQGIGSNLEVMNAETALKEAQTNYYGALFDALTAKVDYDKANGSLIK